MNPGISESARLLALSHDRHLTAAGFIRVALAQPGDKIYTGGTWRTVLSVSDGGPFAGRKITLDGGSEVWAGVDALRRIRRPLASVRPTVSAAS